MVDKINIFHSTYFQHTFNIVSTYFNIFQHISTYFNIFQHILCIQLFYLLSKVRNKERYFKLVISSWFININQQFADEESIDTVHLFFSVQDRHYDLLRPV